MECRQLRENFSKTSKIKKNNVIKCKVSKALIALANCQYPSVKYCMKIKQSENSTALVCACVRVFFFVYRFVERDGYTASPLAIRVRVS